MTNEELKEILKLHKLWLNGEEGGVRANLSEADLRGADLSKADLRWADLSKADLRWANLSKADLRWANLSKADLSEADLSGADLSEADLRGADLRCANLSGANLDFSCWPLWCGSIGVKSDDKIVGQLLWHALEHAKHNGVDIRDINKLIELANNSNPVVKHGKDKV
jgi:uncharacterized protein YjbI with pentapeptide repeats